MSVATRSEPTTSQSGRLTIEGALFILVLGVSVGIWLLTTVGYNAVPFLGVALLGIGSGISTKISSDRVIWKRLVGVILLWVVALGFVGAVVYFASQGLFGGILLATAIFLISHTTVSMTERDYGYGAGKKATGRFVKGGVVLFVGILIFATFEMVAGVVAGPLSSLVPSINGGIDQKGMGVITFSVGTIALYWLANRFPYEILLSISQVEKADTIARVSKLSIITIGILGFVSGGFVLGGGVGDNMIDKISSGIHTVLTSPLLLILWRVLVLSVILIYVSKLLISGVKSIDPQAVFEIGGPAVIVGGLAFTFWSDPLATNLQEVLVNFTGSEYPELVGFITNTPSLLLLVLVLIAFLVSGAVFSLPTMLTRAGSQDRALTGLLAADMSLLFIIMVVSVGESPKWGIIVGIATTALIWEIGEYLITTTGELSGGDMEYGNRRDIITLGSMHSLISGTIAVFGILVAVVILNFTAGHAPNPEVAAGGLVIFTIGLGIVYNILSG